MRHRFNSLWFALPLIAVLAAIIYSNIYGSPFVFDDEFSIEKQIKIRDVSNILSFEELLKPRGIVDFTFALNYKFGQLNVFGYHLVNVLIHILNGFIVYFLASTIFRQIATAPGFDNLVISKTSNPEMNRPPDFLIPLMSLFSALMFTAHPIQTQAVTYTVQRYASVAAMFYMASVLFYLKARVIQQSEERGAQSYLGIEHGAKGKEQGSRFKVQGSKEKVQSSKFKVEKPEIRGQKSEVRDRSTEGKRLSAISYQLSALYLLSILSGMLAFLSKQNTASLPGVILLVEYVLIDRTWQGWKKKIPWFALSSAIWIFFIAYVSGLFSGGGGEKVLLEDVTKHMMETETVGRWRYLCTQFNVLLIYLRLMFLPVGQNLDWLYPFKDGFFDGCTTLAFFFLFFLVWYGMKRVQKQSIVLIGIFWFFITLSVESSIIYSAEINQAIHARIKQAVGSHEDQYNTPQREAYPAWC